MQIIFVRVAEHPDEAVQLPTTPTLRQVTRSRSRLSWAFSSWCVSIEHISGVRL